MKKGKTLRVAALMTATAFATMMMLAACGEKPVEHTHTLQEVAAVAATCTTAGNEAYYKCTDTTCGKLFSDAEGKTEIVAIPTIAATGHDMTKHDEVSATCTTDGVKEYYTCAHEAATVYYADEQGSEKLTDLTIKANGHNMTKHDAVAPTCDSEGNKAYWTCANEPSVVYANAEGTETTTMDQITVAKKQHSIEPVDAVPATCAAPGKQAHFECLSCHKLYSDANGQQLIEDEGSLIIPQSSTHTGTPVFAYNEAPAITETGADLDATCSECKKPIKIHYDKGQQAATSAGKAMVMESAEQVYSQRTGGSLSAYIAIKASKAGTYKLTFTSVFHSANVYAQIARVSVSVGKIYTGTLPSGGCILKSAAVGFVESGDIAVADAVRQTILFNGKAYDTNNIPKDNITISFSLGEGDVTGGDVYFLVSYNYPDVTLQDPACGFLVSLEIL